ncbi:MAG: hypothetical protein HGA85_07295 [Nanoarchaeota archaeon]|nr:hypothetical protein [Nanoarchaeota archaeon]
MASILDISLIGYFGDIFVLLFIFAAAYAVLLFKQPFGPNAGLNALLAAGMALMFIFSKDAIAVVKDSVPWFVVMMVGLMFVLLVTSSVGAQIPASVMGNLGTYILVIGIIVLVINISQHVGQSAGPYLNNENITPDQVVAGQSGDVGSGSYTQNFGATLFHPKVLALMLIIIISVFAVLWIGYVG